MNFRKISFFIIVVSVIGVRSEKLDKLLSLSIAIQQNTIKAKGGKVTCPHYCDENKMYSIRLKNLQSLFAKRSVQPKCAKAGYVYNFFKFFSEDGKDCPSSVRELNDAINEFNIFDINKELIKAQTRSTKEVWIAFSQSQREEIEYWWTEFCKSHKKYFEKTKKRMQSTKDYLESNAKSDEEKEEILKKMCDEVKTNRTKLYHLMEEENPNPKEVYELLKLPFYLGDFN